MRWAVWGTALSASVHFLIAGATTRIPKDAGKHTTTVAVVNAKPKEKPKPKHDEPDKPTPEPPAEVRAPRQAAKRAAEAAPSPAANTPAKTDAAASPGAAEASAAPDFGLSMSGGISGGGLAIATGGGAPGGGSGGSRAGGGAGASAKAAPPKPKGDDGGCSEDAVKPKPQGAVQPQYTDDTRAAGIEGRVRVSLTIDASGNVTDAKVLSGLGHGLDQSALAAAKRMKFTPGSRCGRPVEATFVISMRFVLGQ